MCLCIKGKVVRRTANRDMVVYKVIKYNSATNEYFSVFRYSNIKIGETYTADMQVPTKGGLCTEVHEAVHSFKHKKDAINTFKNELKFDFYKIVKCIIPKDAEYYSGVFCDKPFIASSKLKYVKIIK